MRILPVGLIRKCMATVYTSDCVMVYPYGIPWTKDFSNSVEYYAQIPTFATRKQIMKNRLEYILFRVFVNIQAITPFWLMYLKSDVAAFLMYSVIGYRKKVVRHNLERSFPDKSENEITGIQKKFYH